MSATFATERILSSVRVVKSICTQRVVSPSFYGSFPQVFPTLWTVFCYSLHNRGQMADAQISRSDDPDSPDAK